MDRKEFAENVLLSLYGELDEGQEEVLTGILRDNPEYIDEYRAVVRIYSLAGQSNLEVTDELRAAALTNLDRALNADSDSRQGQ